MAHIHFDSLVHYLSHVACKLLQIVSTEQQTQQTIIFPLAFVSMDFLFTANETEKCLFCIWFSVPSSRLSHPLYYCYFVHRCVYYYNKSRRRRRCACVPVHSLRLYGIQHSFNLLFGGNIRSYFLFFLVFTPFNTSADIQWNQKHIFSQTTLCKWFYSVWVLLVNWLHSK